MEDLTAIERMERRMDLLDYYLSSDEYACTFQTMGQYRAALLKKLRSGMEDEGRI